jgi:hypothetical protein
MKDIVATTATLAESINFLKVDLVYLSPNEFKVEPHRRCTFRAQPRFLSSVANPSAITGVTYTKEPTTGLVFSVSKRNSRSGLSEAWVEVWNPTDIGAVVQEGEVIAVVTSNESANKRIHQVALQREVLV